MRFREIDALFDVVLKNEERVSQANELTLCQ